MFELFEITHCKCLEALPGFPLSLMDVFNGSKYCPTLLETVGLCEPNDKFRDFNLFNVDYKGRNCPSARCTLA